MLLRRYEHSREYMSEIPQEIRSLVDALELRHEEVGEALSHLCRVTSDLGFVDGKAVGAATLYAYLTDGQSEIGERVRRSLTARERLRAVDTFRVGVVLEAFRKDARHVQVEEVRRTMLGIGHHFPQFTGNLTAVALFLTPLFAVQSTLSFRASIDNILDVAAEDTSEERAHAFLRALLSERSVLTQPGNYVLIITDDGTSYQADISQTLLKGQIVETDWPGFASPPTASVSYSWSGAISPAIQGLVEEFGSIINSPVAKELDFQRFFEREPEFLYLLGNYDDVRSQVSIRIESVITPLQSSGEYRPDFFLHNPLTDLWDALDIKKATYWRPLLVGTGATAHDVRRPAAVLAQALGQMRAYQKLLEQTPARDYLRKKHGMLVSRPRCILLMGKEANFPEVEGFTRSELLHTLDDDIDLITYDQLHRVAQHIRRS